MIPGYGQGCRLSGDQMVGSRSDIKNLVSLGNFEFLNSCPGEIALAGYQQFCGAGIDIVFVCAGKVFSCSSGQRLVGYSEIRCQSFAFIGKRSSGQGDVRGCHLPREDGKGQTDGACVLPSTGDQDSPGPGIDVVCIGYCKIPVFAQTGPFISYPGRRGVCLAVISIDIFGECNLAGC